MFQMVLRSLAIIFFLDSHFDACFFSFRFRRCRGCMTEFFTVSYHLRTVSRMQAVLRKAIIAFWNVINCLGIPTNTENPSAARLYAIECTNFRVRIERNDRRFDPTGMQGQFHIWFAFSISCVARVYWPLVDQQIECFSSKKMKNN